MVAEPVTRSAPGGRALAQVTFVVTTGCGSMDLYARKLAERLPVRMLDLGPFVRSGDLFGHALFSTAAVRQLARDVAAVGGSGRSTGRCTSRTTT